MRGYWVFGESAAVEQVPVISAREGQRLLRLHWERERKPELSKAKKQAVLVTIGRLACEACDFDFASVYGELGAGFAECHHVSPLSELEGPRETTLDDLAIVCANCHRMLHKRPWRRVDELRALLQARGFFE
jgi:5-methylcytosine-specific restriction protein A